MREFERQPPERNLIEISNPQPEIRRNAETARDWEYAEEAKYLYRMAALFKDRLLDPIFLTDRRRLPNPVISFENLRNKNTLAAYSLIRNPQGLLYEIKMNTQQYKITDGKNTVFWIFGKWAQLETLLHEQVHLWQQNFGEHPVKPGKVYHNKEFVQKCESLGIYPIIGAGYHIKLADGPFAILMEELGINSPDLRKLEKEIAKDWFLEWLKSQDKERKGKSTLKKWTCPVCGLNARMGIKGNPQIRHDPCEKDTGRIVFFIQESKKSSPTS
jgi:hypothetical protein